MKHFTAFGESKPLSHWARDKRCKVSASAMRDRVASGIPLEVAMVAAYCPRKPRRLFAAFGEVKGIDAWVSDSRCTAKCKYTILRRMKRQGMTFEQALTHVGKGYAAFGEFKSMVAWMSDPRCVPGLSRETIRGRVYRYGMTFEQAITTPRYVRRPQKHTSRNTAA